MIISRTPFRISFFGGGTDYPVWYKEHGGAVLSTSIDKYCFISCRYLPPFFEYKHKISYSIIEAVKQINEIQHPVVKALLNFLKVKEGIEIMHNADLPARTGLGSSSSFTVGLLNALYGLKSIMPTKHKLAKDAIHIERDVLKEAVGSQDQVAASYGGLNKTTFSKSGNFIVEPLILPDKRLGEFHSHLMLYFTGFARYASQIAKKQVETTHKKEKELHEMFKMVDEGKRILTSRGDITDFGKLMKESWALKRSLTDKITNPEIDKIHDDALSAGAIAGKLLGAGGGGFMLFFVKPKDKPAVRKRLKGLLEVGFNFDSYGSQIVFYDKQ